MNEIQMADWVQKITGDKAPLKDLREWEQRIVAATPDVVSRMEKLLSGK